MTSTRLEAFSDGVIAIIITIMVLELRAPEETDLHALLPLLPVFLSYVMSYVYIGIYWNNHHHLLHACERINGAIMWANLHLLFWLSLIPFVTAWMGEHHGSSMPTAAYAIVMLMCAVAYTILERLLIAENGRESLLAQAVGDERKGTISLALYIAAIPLAFVNQWISDAIFVTVALIWLIPDRRIERHFH